MADAALHDGDIIKLHDLKGAAQFNGQFGFVVNAELNNSGRMVVCLDGDLKSLKPANIATAEIPHRVGDLVKLRNYADEVFGHVQGVSAKTGAVIVSTSFKERLEAELSSIQTDLSRDKCFSTGDTVILHNLSKAAMNGKRGRIIGFSSEIRKYIVLMKAPLSKPYKLAPEKLKLFSRGWKTGGMDITNASALTHLLSNTTAVLVDFWSPTCPPCVQLKPMLKNWLHTFNNVAVAFVNVSQNQAACAPYVIEGIPDIRGYFAGKEYKKIVGLNQLGIQSLLKELARKERSDETITKHLTDLDAWQTEVLKNID